MLNAVEAEQAFLAVIKSKLSKSVTEMKIHIIALEFRAFLVENYAQNLDVVRETRLWEYAINDSTKKTYEDIEVSYVKAAPWSESAPVARKLTQAPKHPNRV